VIMLLLYIYLLLVWLVFIRFKLLPFGTASKIAVGVVGAVFVFGILIVVNFLHPQSNDARVYQQVIQVSTRTSQPARVAEVKVAPNVPVKKGDVLFTLEARPFELEAQRLEATLVQAEKAVPQAKAALEGATAAKKRAEDQLQLARTELDRATALRSTGASTQEEIDTRQRNFDVANSSLTAARSAETQARLGIEISTAKADETRAALGKARVDVEETVVKAPADGFVTDLVLRPGFVVRPGEPVLTFVCDPEGVVGVSFPQEYLGAIQAGDEVEVCLDALPGKTLHGKVEAVIPASGAGQLTPTGELPTVTQKAPAARFPVKVRLDPADLERYHPPAGASGAAAVYTEHGKGLKIVRRVVLRWYTWLNYVKVSM
jgi:multidrug resistance efflux pump